MVVTCATVDVEKYIVALVVGALAEVAEVIVPAIVAAVVATLKLVDVLFVASEFGTAAVDEVVPESVAVEAVPLGIGLCAPVPIVEDIVTVAEETCRDAFGDEGPLLEGVITV